MVDMFSFLKVALSWRFVVSTFDSWTFKRKEKAQCKRRFASFLSSVGVRGGSLETVEEYIFLLLTGPFCCVIV